MVLYEDLKQYADRVVPLSQLVLSFPHLEAEVTVSMLENLEPHAYAWADYHIPSRSDRARDRRPAGLTRLPPTYRPLPGAHFVLGNDPDNLRIYVQPDYYSAAEFLGLLRATPTIKKDQREAWQRRVERAKEDAAGTRRKIEQLNKHLDNIYADSKIPSAKLLEDLSVAKHQLRDAERDASEAPPRMPRVSHAIVLTLNAGEILSLQEAERSVEQARREALNAFTALPRESVINLSTRLSLKITWKPLELEPSRDAAQPLSTRQILKELFKRK